MKSRQAAGSSLELVGLIYESAMDPGAPRELLRRLQVHLGSDCLQLQTRKMATGEILHSEISGDAPSLHSLNQDYLQPGSPADPLAALLLSLPDGEVRRCQDHFDEGFAAADPFFQHLVLTHGLRWAIGGVFHHGSGCANLLIGRRSPEAGPFNETVVAALRELIPHLRRACALRAKVQQRTRALDTAGELLRQLPVAYMLTDRFGRCIESNERFSDVARRLAVHLVLGRARFDRPEQHDLWERTLRETLITGIEQTMLAIGSDGSPCPISVKPWPVSGIGPDGAPAQWMLAVFGAKGLPVEPPPALAARKSRLTRAELDVLASLLQGLSAKTISGQRGASVNTVRSQIVAILEKTGFNSQRELIASFGASGFSESGFTPAEIQQSSRIPGT